MSYDDNMYLTNELVDRYLYELSKELKKEYGRTAEFELIVVGGAAIMMNYNFRTLTADIDTYVAVGGSVKGAVRRVADAHNISDNWLNSDFKITDSFSYKISQYSQFYKKYNQILTVRVISREYLVAMKLASFRPYKRDKSDVIGILEEHKLRGNKITFEEIDRAVNNLYGGWDRIDNEAKRYVQDAIDNNYTYKDVIEEENQNKELLIDFEKDYKDVLSKDNLEDVLAALRKKRETDPRKEVSSKAPKI